MPQADPSELIQPHLRRKERLVWAGRPSGRSFVSVVAWIAMVFGLGFLGMIGAILFQMTQAGSAMPIIGAVITAPFSLVSLAILQLPYLEYQQGRQVVYAVTNRRAMILKLGEKPLVKSYHPGDFTRFDVANDSILFAGDSALDGFMPGHRGQPESTVAPVGFVGLAPEAVSEVRKHLEALKTAEPEEGDTLDTRRSADLERIHELGARYATAKEKLEAWAQTTTREESARQWDAHGGCLKTVTVLFVLALVATVGAAIYFRNPEVLVGAGAFLGPIFIGLFLMALFVKFAFQLFYGSRVQKRPDTFPLLERLEGDRHPDTFLYGWLDLGDVRGVRPVRMANSPHSHALKSYHKHHWARFVLGLADGNQLALSLVDKVKLKSSFEVSRRHFMRGRLRVNPAHYDLSRLTEPFMAGRLSAVPQAVDGGVVVFFGGEIAQPAEAAEQLAALYRQLPVRT